MAFGPIAKFIAERGFGRLISKEEALKVLDRAEKAGLVHCSSNTGEYIDYICNCCMCHCLLLQSINRAVLQVGPATSSFIVVVDEEECTGCGDCIDRCQMEALSMQDDIVAMDADRCFGCGLCISVCPASALRMEPREQRPIPPRDRMELNIAMMVSMPFCRMMAAKSCQYLVAWGFTSAELEETMRALQRSGKSKACLLYTSDAADE